MKENQMEILKFKECICVNRRKKQQIWRYINRDFAKWMKESNITITQKTSEESYQMQRRETGAEKEE